MNVREYASKYIKDYNSRILEFGPLTRCLLDRKKYKNYFFADIRSTEEVKNLYSGNEYLKRTGIEVNTDDVIDIDFVVKGSYKDTFKNVEKFDYVIVSHVLEHIPNLLDFFIDVQNILKRNGEIIIIYPDRRFSFDHFRSDSKFSDIYDVWKGSKTGVARQTLDFYTNVIPENNPVKFWNIDEEVPLCSKVRETKGLDVYNTVKKGKQEDDIHYWPFSDFSFIKFLRDCKVYDIFPFTIKTFVPTQKNTQEFLVILSKGGEIPDKKFCDYMREGQDYFFYNYLGLNIYIEEKERFFSEIAIILNNIYKYVEEKNVHITELENIIVEKSRFRTMAKGIMKKLLAYPQIMYQSLMKKIKSNLNK